MNFILCELSFPIAHTQREREIERESEREKTYTEHIARHIINIIQRLQFTTIFKRAKKKCENVNKMSCHFSVQMRRVKRESIKNRVKRRNKHKKVSNFLVK